jgi:tight adherence protein C
MRTQFLVSLLFILPIIFVLNPGFSWEKLSLEYIGKIGDRSSIREKFLELGYKSEIDYENFRYRQLIFAFLLSFSELLALFLLGISPMKIALIALSSSCGVLFLTEKKVEREVRTHRERLESDFPAVVEMLTLSLSAGESPLVSMERISRTASGSLAKEFGLVIAEVSRGTPFIEALDAMGRRVHSLSVRRFIDALVIAMTRGAPVIDVLHSHAREARDFQRNRVLGAASKAELSMMIPVVFLILPISILFALWPSLSNLNLFAQG